MTSTDVRQPLAPTSAISRRHHWPAISSFHEFKETIRLVVQEGFKFQNSGSVALVITCEKKRCDKRVTIFFFLLLATYIVPMRESSRVDTYEPWNPPPSSN